MVLSQMIKSNAINVDFVVNWLRSEIAALNNILNIIEKNHSYSDEYVKETMKKAEIDFKQIRKFIDEN
ncbi:MAG: hypothetical protein PHY73_06500 [Candidatus Omnitrophica bacterium]|nr:hypothetical protein [Candidatus Omnitrophota bacterium]